MRPPPGGAPAASLLARRLLILQFDRGRNAGWRLRHSTRCARAPTARSARPIAAWRSWLDTHLARAARGDAPRGRPVLPPPRHHLRRLWRGRRRTRRPSRSTSFRGSSPGTNGSILHKGLVQRVRALNAFLADAYGEREICRAGVIPEQQILMNAEFVADGAGPRAAGRRARPYRRHRPGAGRREGLLRPRGQCAHAVGRVLRAGEPRSDDAARRPSCSRRCACCRSPTTPRSCWRPCARCRSATMPSPTSCC